MVYRIVVSFTWQPPTTNPIPNGVCEITHLDGFMLACFDGAALLTEDCCAAGGIFKSYASRVTKWYLNCGVGTNTKAKLLGLWATLTLPSFWAIDKIQILGDSKVIIDWMNHKSQLQVVNLDGWK
jgi:ribonuclease HI